MWIFVSSLAHFKVVIITSNEVISSSCLQKTPQNCLEVPATRAARLLVLTRPILVRSVINAVPIVDAVAHFYHICYITVRILKREPRFLTQVHS